MPRIGFVAVEPMQVLSLSAFTAFQAANALAGKKHYQLRLVSEAGGMVMTSAGFRVETEPLGDDRFDTVLVSAFGSEGGDHFAPESLRPQLVELARDARRVAAYCTGAFALAEAGLLEGRRATIHFRHIPELARRFPGVKIVDDRLYVTDGKFWTAAGMTTAFDITLALIEDDFGAELTREVARRLVMERRRPGGLPQQSAMLDVASRSDRIESVIAYAKANLSAPLTVNQLAEVAHLSPRQFSRAFATATGQSPAKVVERLRVEAAQAMIVASRHSLDTIAAEVGFADRERMRRAFVRVRGVAPQAMRRMTRDAEAA